MLLAPERVIRLKSGSGNPQPFSALVSGRVMEDQVRNFLEDNGAEFVGFTAAEPFSDWNISFRQRLRDGTLPAHYEKRLNCDPRDILPAAETLIVFGVRYDGLAAWGDAKAVPLLKGLANFRYPEVVEAARWSLAKLSS